MKVVDIYMKFDYIHIYVSLKHPSMLLYLSILVRSGPGCEVMHNALDAHNREGTQMENLSMVSWCLPQSHCLLYSNKLFQMVAYTSYQQ